MIGRRVLTGTDAVQLDTPEPSVVQLAYNSYRTQLTLTPGDGEQFVALDNASGPFANEDLRKALWAALTARRSCRRAAVGVRSGDDSFHLPGGRRIR